MKIGDIVAFDYKKYVILEIKPRTAPGITLLGNIVVLQSIDDPTDKLSVYDFDL